MSAAAIAALESVHDVLVEQPHRWRQNQMWLDEHGRPATREEATCGCLLGILSIACGGSESSREVARGALARAIDGRRPKSHVVAEWNDRRGRTVAEVRFAVLDAIHLLRTGR